jgi:putative ABC transport system substrate-binding protein
MPPTRVRRIGYLFAGTRAVGQRWADAFADQLRTLGWIEGENLIVEWRFSEGHNEILPEVVAELIRLPVEVIVSGGAQGTTVAHQATSTIPIVMMLGQEPTAPSAPGMVESFARPGGNVTGTVTNASAWTTKSVELLKTLLPHISRLAILGDRSAPNDVDLRTPTAQAAQTFGIQVLDLDVDSAPGVDGLFEAAQLSGADAIYVLAIGTLNPLFARICELSIQTRIPSMSMSPVPVTDYGGLVAYGPDYVAAWRQGADYVDKILRGASPADLPVEEPRQYDFILNVKTAQALGIALPPDAAAQVTQWIQ